MLYKRELLFLHFQFVGWFHIAFWLNSFLRHPLSPWEGIIRVQSKYIPRGFFCGNEKNKPLAMQVSFQKASASGVEEKKLPMLYDVSLTTTSKYRRQISYGQIKAKIGKNNKRFVCEWKGIEIVKTECCSDHIHMLIKVPSKYSISEIMGYLKGKSSEIYLTVMQMWNINREIDIFLCRGYYIDTVGKMQKKSKNIYEITCKKITRRIR